MVFTGAVISLIDMLQRVDNGKVFKREMEAVKRNGTDTEGIYRSNYKGEWES